MNPDAQSLLSSQFFVLDRNFDTLHNLVRSSGLPNISIELLGLIALRFISDSDIFSDSEEANRSLPVASDWRAVVRNASFHDISERLVKLAHAVERHHESLAGVFTRSLLTDLPRWPANFVHQLVFQLSSFSMSFLGEDDVRVFGHWFDRCLSMVLESDLTSAPYVTPRSVGELMAKLADLRSGLSIMDPSCGAGTVLACCAEAMYRSKERCDFFGQEINIRPWALCRLRLFLLRCTVDQVTLGDTLRQPAFGSDTELKRFDRVICDPPLGMHLDAEELDRIHRRFKLPSRGKVSAESAFVQHVISRLGAGGVGLVLVSHGFLFRTGIDARIREELIRDSYIKAVIGLPAKLRAETSIETALILFHKHTHSFVTFIDGATLQHSLRGRTHISLETIETIWKLLDSGEDRLGVCRHVSFEEVAKTGYSFVPKHYMSLPKLAHPDVAFLCEELRSLESKHQQIVGQMDQLIRTLEQEY